MIVISVMVRKMMEKLNVFQKSDDRYDLKQPGLYAINSKIMLTIL